jgi:polyhydroxyalkanoate synthase
VLRPAARTLKAENLVARGRPTYLVDYGPLVGADSKVGIEHFINDVLPPAIRKVSEDAGGRDVHLVGWCMGGLLSIGDRAAGLP